MHPLEFAKIALQDWRIGALAVSSRYVVERILHELRPDYKTIVEYGAGEGVVTRSILQYLPADGRIVAIEQNSTFVRELQQINDPRLTVIHADALAVPGRLPELGLPRLDAVISNIPLSFLPASKRRDFLTTSYRALSEGGLLIVYQYSPLILPILRKLSQQSRALFEPRNFPPYFIMVAPK